MSSRRSIPALETDLSVVVGWDNPMTTFFAYVRREGVKDEYAPPLLWIGTQAKVCLCAEDLVAPLAPYATLTDELVAQLRADRAQDADRNPNHRRLGAIGDDRRDLIRRDLS